MIKTKIQINLEEFPAQIHPYLQGTVYDSSSSDVARVYYSDRGYYTKVSPEGTLKEEAERSKLFAGLGLGVEVVAYISEGKDYLVTKEAAGQDLTHYLDKPEQLCKAMAETLKKLHATPTDGLPVSVRMPQYQELAEGKVSGYAEYILMPRFFISSEEEAKTIIKENYHRIKSDTLIHGDYCLPNVILNDWNFSALIDFNLAGVGDKHIDLYWALWSLNYNLKTDAYTDCFLDAYGRENFDYEMLRVIAAFELLG